MNEVGWILGGSKCDTILGIYLGMYNIDDDIADTFASSIPVSVIRRYVILQDSML